MFRSIVLRCKLRKLSIIVTIAFAYIALSYVHGQANARTNESSTIIAVGDWGCTPKTLIVSDLIRNKNPDLVLGLGDYVLEKNSSADCFFNMIHSFQDKMKIAIGPHDIAPELFDQYVKQFNLTRQYYSFNHKNIHFITISAEIPFKKYTPQYEFVTNDLENATKNTLINWIVVFFHKPAYTSSPIGGKIAESIRDTYHPLFDKYGVDLVLQAHNHYYERTFPIMYNELNSTNPIVTDHNMTKYDSIKGPIFITSGTGGGDLHAYKGEREYTANYYEGQGFVEIKINKIGTMLNETFHSMNGMSYDEFNIVKSKSCTNNDVIANRVQSVKC